MCIVFMNLRLIELSFRPKFAVHQAKQKMIDLLMNTGHEFSYRIFLDSIYVKKIAKIVGGSRDPPLDFGKFNE